MKGQKLSAFFVLIKRNNILSSKQENTRNKFELKASVIVIFSCVEKRSHSPINLLFRQNEIGIRHYSRRELIVVLWLGTTFKKVEYVYESERFGKSAPNPINRFDRSTVVHDIDTL